MINYGVSTCKPCKIDRVRFAVMSADDIRRMSVVSVTETTIYSRGLPMPGGIQDARMGTVDRRILCGTCNQDMSTCPGHPGHIELPFPMYHALFFETVLKIIRSTCFFCNRVCATEDDIACVAGMSGKNRFLQLYSIIKGRKRCNHCNATRPNFVRNSMSIRVEWPSDVDFESEEERTYCTRTFSQRDALSMLSMLTDDDCRTLGFDPVMSHPKNMVLTVVLVPPPAVRPTIMTSEGSKTRGQDDLTHKLQDIVKRSQDLRQAMGDESWRHVAMVPDLIDRIARLQYEVFTIVNNTVRGQRPSVQRSGVPTKSYIGRLKGKDGRIRGNLMGKRVDFCARSVISPGPALDLDQVGIPERIALGITVPETVTALNVDALTKRVHVGAMHIDGAESIIMSDGSITALSHCKTHDKICLQVGWVVERYLQSGDIVAFNRQPSLHKMGLMGHRVVIVDGMTMRMNLSVTSPYNADFDGDEMNLHVPQNIPARTGVQMLMRVTTQLISPQANKPSMGIVQDSLIGAYRMTRMQELIPKNKFAHIFMHARHISNRQLPRPALVLGGIPYWTGKQLISMALPSSLCIDREMANPKTLDDMNNAVNVVVLYGQLLAGQLNKGLLGTSSGSIVDVACRTIGNDKTAQLISDIQRITSAYNEWRGFSVGISDCVLGAKGKQEVRERVSMAMQLANDIDAEISHADMSAEDTQQAETTIRRILSKSLMQAGSIVEKNLDRDNAIRAMVNSGSKGSFINLSQIHVVAGQQSVEGRRITSEKGTRTLPCFQFNERSLASQGFVDSSYTEGLRPAEFFFHSMGGREGIVDTAVKTAATGYIQRREIKAMESHTVRYDGTVRNASDEIVQFVYGAAGFDASRIERIKLSWLKAPVEQVRREFGDAADAILAERDLVLRNANVLGTEMDERTTLPFSPERILKTFETQIRKSPATRAQQKDIRRACAQFDKWIDKQTHSATLRFVCRTIFPHSLLSRAAPDEIDKLRALLAKHATQANVAAGEAVGCIGAQSIGEPTTQMTLNTFHFAGCASKNVTLGIPRLQELLTVSKNMKIASITVRFTPKLMEDQSFIDYFSDTLPMTTLGDVIASCDIVDDPDVTTSNIASDKWMVETDLKLRGGWNPEKTASRFVIRLVLSSEMLWQRRTTAPQIRHLLRLRLGPDRAHIVSSEVNDIEQVLRIRLLHVDAMVARASMPPDRQGVLSNRVANVLLSTLVISGHPTVSQTQVRAETSDVLQTSDDGHLQTQRVTEHVVDAMGASLMDLSVAECVDWERCYSNDLIDVQANLGISAAAEVLFNELKEVISFDGTYIFPGHLQLIVDTMTRDGRLKPLNRFGVNREHSNALARSSYEETPDVLTEAAIHAEDTEAKGVSTSIILGQPAATGTGVVDVRFHPSMLPQQLSIQSSMSGQIYKSTVRPGNTKVESTVEYGTLPSIEEQGAAETDDAEPTRDDPMDDEGDMYGHGEGMFQSIPVTETFVLHTPDVSDAED